MTYGNGVVVTYEYDKFDRVETVECDGYETRYYYSAEGSLERTEDEKSGRTTYYIYDGIGRLVRSTAYEGGEIVEDEVYCYDDLNRTSEVFTKAGTHENVQSYTYDTSDGSLTKLENENDSTTDIVEYTYDYLKRLSEKEISNGDDYLLYEYSYANRPNDNTKTTTLIDNVVVSNNDKTLNDFLYEYDNVGNIIWEDNFSDAEITYSYDELGQLVEVDDSRTAEIYKYYYDNFGNILKKETYKYGSLQSTYEYGYTDSNWRDLLTSYRGQSITYDEIGNPLSYYNGSSYTFTWSEGRKLASATVGSNAVTYNYENGNRVSKTVNGTVHNYYYVGGNLVSETWGTNSLSFLYDESGVYGFIYNNGTTSEIYYYGKNLQGDVIDLYDNEMNRIAYYEYDAWGNLNAIYANNGSILAAQTHSTHPAVVNPLRYRSYYYDTETSFYFLNSRYYDAKIGRFISPDTTDILTATPMDLTDKNLYAYCDNNPIIRIDSDGEFWNVIIGAVVGGAINAVTTAVKSYKEEGTIDWKKVAISGAVGAVSGAVAATGLGVIAQAGITAGAAFAGDIATQVICEKKEISDIDYGKAFHNASVAGVCSLIGSGIGYVASHGAGPAIKGQQLLSTGRDRCTTAMLRRSVGQSHSSMMKSGSNMIIKAKKLINTGYGICSVSGSISTWGISNAWSK